MALAAGTRLGRYEILSQLGVGGMGEVYLAKDSKLDRKVALKILPSEVASKQERMTRFVREARAAAALNHPNIAHIYEIGEEDGVHLIAMEFVDGQTLRKKIHAEHTDLRKLLLYLQQVAEGLAKAHAAGIVHRDLKPDNIMISRDGFAKILDFGLAKLIGSEAVLPQAGGFNNESNEAATAIMPQPLSIPGMIMGTVNYMSPEQAQGKKEIDERSDIFSFGSVLYEATTRQQPFSGDSIVDTLHRIIYAPAPPLSDFNPDAPNDLQRIVRRCLQKDPEERYQTIKDVAIELKQLLREMESEAGLHLSVAPPPPNVSNTASVNAPTAFAASGQRELETKESTQLRSTSSAEYLAGEIKRHKKLVGVFALALLLAIGGIVFALYKFGRQDKPAATSAQMKIERLTTNGKSSGAAISPDGKYVVYIFDEGGQQSLWTRQVVTTSNVQITPPTDVRYRGLIFSPDGNYINFVKQEKSDVPPALYQMSVLGGNQKKLISDIYSAVSYAPDGKQFAFVRQRFPSVNESSLLIANADGTGERILASLKRVEEFPSAVGEHPAWSPDEKTIAAIANGGAFNRGKVVEVQVADGTMKLITAQSWNRLRRVAWLPAKSGLLILGADKASANFAHQIWRVSYPDGEARRITTDLNDYVGMSLTADSNTLVTVQTNYIFNIWVAPNGDASRAVQVKSGGNNLDGITGLTWTPDGRIVYSSLASGGHDIWIMNGDGSGQKQLTVEAGVNNQTRVTPDGRYIVFNSIREDVENIWRMDLDGGNPKQLTSGNMDEDAAISPDSRWVIYGSESSGNNRLWKVSIDGGSPVQLTDYLSDHPRVSPDGKLIACQYRADNNSPWRPAIIPFEGGKPVKIFDFPGGRGNFRWSRDSRSLLYQHTRGGVGNIWSFPLDDNPPKQLTNFKTEQIGNFDWSADGKQLVLARGTITSDVVLIRDFR